MRERRRRWLVVVTLVSALGTTVPPAHAATPSATAGPALTVDVAGDRHAISREIYGVNHADGASARSLGLTVDRMGGNAQTRYNYQTGFHNTGSDWYFENIPPASTSTRPHDAFIQKDRAAGMRTIIQVPLIGWTPKAPSPASHPFACGFKVSKYGAQQGADWQWDPDCGNGTRTNGTPVTGNDPTDTSTAIDSTWVKGWVQALVGRYRTAADGGVRHYELDNEPALWNSTHRDVHPAPVTYDELRTRTVTYAAAVKAADAGALTLGPSDWGWCAYFYSAPDGCSAGADHAAHGNRDFAPWYLAQLRAASQSAGRRLLDYFDEHYYPQSGVALRDAGDASMRALRLRSTRSLWDPTYVDESWIGRDVGAPPMELIRRMRRWVAAEYPGTKTAITEYDFGGLESLNGALTQADVLGIFGRERLDLAALWAPGSPVQPWAHAFRMYRNYDGRGSRFGDVGVRALSGGTADAGQGQLAIYAAERSSDRAVTLIVINKTEGALASPVSLAGFVPSTAAQVWRYSASDLTRIVRQPDAPVSVNRVSVTYPANSITLLVVPERVTATITPPATTTGTVRVAFSAAVNGVTTGNVVLRADGTGTNVAAAVACYRGTTTVSCASGRPTSAVLRPSSPLVPGRDYAAWVNPVGAPTYVRGLAGNPVMRASRTFRLSS